MAQNATPTTFESMVREMGSTSIVWELKNWKTTHDVLVAGKASCLMEFENPKVSLRFFLKPVDKICRSNNAEYNLRFYSLCADVMESNGDGVAKIVAKVVLKDATTVAGDGEIKLSRGGRELGLVVIEEFIAVKLYSTVDPSSHLRSAGTFHRSFPISKLWQQQDISIDIWGTLYELGGSGGGDEAGARALKSTEPEASMLRHMKIMYAAGDNFSDLKLETKDNMTLSAHKFLLAARSPVFRAMIEEAVKNNGFDGVIKMEDVNAKPLVVILHWIYSGELHENAGKVMEEVVEAAMKYQLGDLLKILDKKMIEICTVDNMFQLFQVAKRIPMPTAMDDISLFIKGNL